MSIIVSGTIHVDPADRDAFLAARAPILEHARAAPGCLDFSLSPDLLDPGRVNVYERWESHAIARYVASQPKLSRWYSTTSVRTTSGSTLLVQANAPQARERASWSVTTAPRIAVRGSARCRAQREVRPALAAAAVDGY